MLDAIQVLGLDAVELLVLPRLIALLVMLLYTLGRYTPFFGAIHALVPGVDLFRRPADGTFLIGALACAMILSMWDWMDGQ